MTDPIIPPALVFFSLRLLPVLLSVLIKASVLLALAFVLQWFMKNAPARLRHALWLSSILGSVLILALSLRGPLFELARPPAEAAGAMSALSSTLVPPSGSFAVQGTLPPITAVVWHRTTIPGIWPDLWPPMVVLFLIAGALWSWLWMLRGRVRPAGQRRGEQDNAAKEYDRSVRELSRLLGIRREIRVIEGKGSVTPFTRGVLHPLIILPPAMRTWSAARMRSVLLHELCHIKHGDSVSLAIAYWICSLLWFVPLIWPAYSRLCAEQEMECDEAVVDSGVRRHSYAACVLDAAQLCRGPAQLAARASPGAVKKS